MKFRLERVKYIPADLRAGVLYVSEEFRTAAHLCACGCGSKVRTPLGPTEWELEESSAGPSLKPSIGNWQRPCKSHYWIQKGQVVWARAWTAEEILAGRRGEEMRRQQHYDLAASRPGILRRVAAWLYGLFK